MTETKTPECTAWLEACGTSALELHIKVVAPPGEYKNPEEFEFVLSPKNCKFAAGFVKLSDMIVKRQGQQNIYTWVCLGNRTSEHPSVDIMRVFRRNYIDTMTVNS